MIRLNHLSRLYPARAEAPGGMIRALDDFSLHVQPGERRTEAIFDLQGRWSEPTSD